MNRPWILVVALFLLAPLPACVKDDAAASSDIRITFVDRDEERRLREEALRRIDHGEMLARFVTEPEPLAGWLSAGNAVTADQASLESSDGIEKAGAMAKHGIEAYRKETLVHPDHEGVTVDLELVRAQKLLGAFGIYASYRDPALDYDTRGLGNQGFVDGNRLFLWHSRWFARATWSGGTPEEERTEALIELGRELSSRMQEIQRPILPRQLRAFPGTDVIANSQRYDTDPFLGLDFLPLTLTAEYARAEGLLRAFLIHEESPEAAADTFDRLKEHFEGSGALIDGFLGIATDSFRADVPGEGVGAFLLQREFVFGFLGFEGDTLAMELLQSFVTSLDGLFPDPDQRMFGTEDDEDEDEDENDTDESAGPGSSTSKAIPGLPGSGS